MHFEIGWEQETAISGRGRGASKAYKAEPLCLCSAFSALPRMETEFAER